MTTSMEVLAAVGRLRGEGVGKGVGVGVGDEELQGNGPGRDREGAVLSGEARAITSHMITTKIGVLHVEEQTAERRRDDGGRPVILCWPSLFADARTLDAITRELVEEDGYRVLVIDGPGHGKSPPSDMEAFSLGDSADAAMEVLDALGVERVVGWIGSAWGGHVGVAAAIRYAARIDALFILNTPMGQWRGKRLALLRLSQLLLRVFGPQSLFVARIIADKAISPHAGPDREALVATAVDALRRCDPRGLRGAIHSAMFGREDLIPRLHEIAVAETTFFAGTDDGIFPLDEARSQADAIPSCRFVAVERSAHHSAMERPDVVLPIVREVLTRRRRSLRGDTAR